MDALDRCLSHQKSSCAKGAVHTWLNGQIIAHCAGVGAVHSIRSLPNVLDRSNTGSTVWADTAYRSKKNEAWLEKNGFFSDIHHKKPKGRPMSEATSRAKNRRSKTRAFVEHVFAQQKSRMGLFVRSIGITRARTKIGMANLAYNMSRYVWHQGRTAPVIIPFFVGFKTGLQAAVLSFITGVIPPMAMLGRSLLYVHSQLVA